MSTTAKASSSSSAKKAAAPARGPRRIPDAPPGFGKDEIPAVLEAMIYYHIEAFDSFVSNFARVVDNVPPQRFDHDSTKYAFWFSQASLQPPTYSPAKKTLFPTDVRTIRVRRCWG